MPDGSWVPATPIADTFVVNSRHDPAWTNGLYHSNPHACANTHSGNAARYSIPFSTNPIPGPHRARARNRRAWRGAALHAVPRR